MHITDGVLHPAVLLGGYVAGGLLAVYGARKMAAEEYPRVGLLTAGFFVAGFLRIPLGMTSVHMTLTGLTGVVLGRRCLPAIFVGLLLQSLLLGHGGVSAVGVNMVIMGVPAWMAALLFRQWVRRLDGNSDSRHIDAASFVCGALAILLSAMLLFATLAFMPLQGNASRDAYGVLAWSALALHIPVMLLEGILTVLVVRYIRRAVPELMAHPVPGSPTSGEAHDGI